MSAGWYKGMPTVNDLSKGKYIVLGGTYYIITKDPISFKPLKGSSKVQLEIKNLKTGQVHIEVFNDGACVPTADLERRSLQYSYTDGTNYYFMDDLTFEEVVMSSDDVKNIADKLEDNMYVDILFDQYIPICVVLAD